MNNCGRFEIAVNPSATSIEMIIAGRQRNFLLNTLYRYIASPQMST